MRHSRSAFLELNDAADSLRTYTSVWAASIETTETGARLFRDVMKLIMTHIRFVIASAVIKRYQTVECHIRTRTRA